MFSLLVNAVISLLNCANTSSLDALSFSWKLFSLLNHFVELYITDSALKVS